MKSPSALLLAVMLVAAVAVVSTDPSLQLSTESSSVSGFPSWLGNMFPDWAKKLKSNAPVVFRCREKWCDKTLKCPKKCLKRFVNDKKDKKDKNESYGGYRTCTFDCRKCKADC